MKWWHTVYESVCERERKGEGDGCVIIREEGEGIDKRQLGKNVM